MGRLAAPENPDVHLETMEEAKNESRKPKEAGLAGMASLRGGVLPEGLLEQCETCQRTNGDYEQETRTSRILQSIRQVRVPALMRLNRRVPNGTHGGVGGRSLNEWVSSYPIVSGHIIRSFRSAFAIDWTCTPVPRSFTPTAPGTGIGSSGWMTFASALFRAVSARSSASFHGVCRWYFTIRLMYFKHNKTSASANPIEPRKLCFFLCQDQFPFSNVTPQACWVAVLGVACMASAKTVTLVVCAPVFE